MAFGCVLGGRLGRGVGSECHCSHIGEQPCRDIEQVAIVIGQAASVDSDRLRQRSVQDPGEFLHPCCALLIAEPNSGVQRAQLDGARILSRLMRQMDFGAVQVDGSVIVVFAETDLRTAHMIARRLSSVMRHTTHGKRDTRSEPAVTLATMMPSDTAQSLLARLYDEARRAAS